MPIYEYQCKSCDHLFDALQKLSDPPLTQCPECGEAQLTKLVSAAGFRLKGGGWYETDFKRDKRRNVAGDDNSGGETKSESKDNKPDKKAKESSAKDKPKDKSKDKPAKNSNAAA